MISNSTALLQMTRYGCCSRSSTPKQNWCLQYAYSLLSSYSYIYTLWWLHLWAQSDFRILSHTSISIAQKRFNLYANRSFFDHPGLAQPHEAVALPDRCSPVEDVELQTSSAAWRRQVAGPKLVKPMKGSASPSFLGRFLWKFWFKTMCLWGMFLKMELLWRKIWW